MENASKALIIVAAIIVSILIVGLGMMVFNKANNATGDVDLTPQEIASFNSKFEAYEGKIKGAQLRSLVSAIIYNNTNNIEGNKINLKVDSNVFSDTDLNQAAGTNTQTLLNKFQKNIKSQKFYKVVFNYSADGRINGCTVSY